MATSKAPGTRLFVYLQRPDNGEWVTVGAYLPDGETGKFIYAPSYVEAGLAWSIDPVNLPFQPDALMPATRYRGLHDALRDASPDAWGQALLRRSRALPDNTPDWRYLAESSNAERWGALAVGTGRRPSIAHIASPKLPELELLAAELIAIAQHAPPVDAKLRARLVKTPSMGGARPKATIRHGEQYWIIKPYLPSDVVNIPLLEHLAQSWGRAAGMHFAATAYHPIGDGRGAVRVLRFDREGPRRHMALSGATLLQTEYPGKLQQAEWSYPRLAEELRRIGAPVADRIELFERMVFNAVIGNDDDHPRNHAVVFVHHEQRWRLAPAFDVVPNPEAGHPDRLAMQLSKGRFDIGRDAILADHARFGFATPQLARAHLDALLQRIARTIVAPAQHSELARLLTDRLAFNLARLADPGHNHA